MSQASRGNDRRSTSDRRSGLDRRGLLRVELATPGRQNRRNGVERRRRNRRGSSFGSSKGMETALGYGPYPSLDDSVYG